MWTAGFTAIGLFSVSFVLRVMCTGGYCLASTQRRLLGLDGLGSLPRLFIVGLFVAGVVFAITALRRSSGAERRWWWAVAAVVAFLVVAKSFSLHSAVKSESPALTLITAVGLSVLSLLILYRWGRRLDVVATVPVVLTLGLYAAAALGLDAATSSVELLHGGAGFLGWAAGTFIEELGEALTALSVVVALCWNVPRSTGEPRDA